MKFFAVDLCSPFNLELETVESIEKDPFLKEIWAIFERMVKSWVS
jgi:hypothetical protein